MMKAMNLEDLEKVNGGTIDGMRKLMLMTLTIKAKVIDRWTLEHTQDVYAQNQEERDYIAQVWG
jgi:hypothetical protein